MTAGYRAAVAAFETESEGGWAALPFFRNGQAGRIGDKLDAMVASGDKILPQAADVFAALRLTPPEAVRAVILGQDPYPTPGDAHGLAFSVRDGVAVPRSLRNIFREAESDVAGWTAPASGNLSAWNRQGVLLLNACLTVEAGQPAAHRGLGWEQLADDVIRRISAHSPGAAFILWGADAQKRRALIDENRHLVIATAHPSPLSARRGFFGSRPFSLTNAWLAAHGRPQIDWRL
ncbi:MAG: uracil-DNA glycosylase [Beijerinckiaceae bacterium]